MSSDLSRRVQSKELRSKIASAETAVGIVKSGMTIAVTGDVRVITEALSQVANRTRDFTLNVWSGTVDIELDRTLGDLRVIKRRIGQQSHLRKHINDRTIAYCDPLYSKLYRAIEAKVLGPLDVAIVEAIAITEDGNIVPSYAVADMPYFVKAATKLIVKLATAYPLEMEGMHDIYSEPTVGPVNPVAISRVEERIGTPFVPVDKSKICYIVEDDKLNPRPHMQGVDDVSIKIAQNVVSFLKNEVADGRLPKNLVPIEMGVGKVPQVVPRELMAAGFENLEIYSPLINDGCLDLIDQGKARFVSGSMLFLSEMGQRRFLERVSEYKKFIILRPIGMWVFPEMCRRLPLVTLNGAIEADIYGHVNASHLLGTDVVNGVGGLADYAHNAYISIVAMPSTTRDGAVSSIVPMVPHVDLTEHMVDAIITEQGVADLRWLSPTERAERIVQDCAHPSYQGLLRDYFSRACRAVGGHEPHLLGEAFSFHQRFAGTNTMQI